MLLIKTGPHLGVRHEGWESQAAGVMSCRLRPACETRVGVSSFARRWQGPIQGARAIELSPPDTDSLLAIGYQP